MEIWRKDISGKEINKTFWGVSAWDFLGTGKETAVAGERQKNEERRERNGIREIMGGRTTELGHLKDYVE